MSTPIEPSPALIAELLARSSADEQTALLQQANLWHEDGLASLMAAGRRLIDRDLIPAQRLLDLCIALAPAIAPALQPQAVYLHAQTLAMNGRFEQALAAIDRAQAGFRAGGQTAAALRTAVGRLNVLVHLGRYPDALATAEDALAGVAQEVDLPPETAATLTAHLQNNRGICFKYMGRYAAAVDAYEAAERHFRQLGQDEDAANVQMNRGVLLAELGHGQEALAAYEAAAAIYAQTGNRRRQAQNLENKGELFLWLGNYNQSLEALAAARELFVAVDASLELYILERLTADAYLALNLLPEATAAYRAAVAGLETGETSPDVPHYLGGALWGLGATLLRRNRPAAAAAALDRAAAIFAAAGNDHLHSAVLVEQSALAEAGGEPESALALALQAFELTAGQDWPVQRTYALLRLVDLLLPDTVAAAPLLEKAEQTAAALPLPPLRFRVQQRLGRLYLLQGRETEAEQVLLAAMSEAERLRGSLARQSLRTSFLQDKMAVYADLLRLYLAREDQDSLQKAFQVAEQAKSRALVDLLNSDIEARQRPDLDPELSRRLEQLQADLHALYNEALRDNQEGERTARLVELNDRATRLEEEISRLQLQTVGGGAPVSRPQPPASAPLAQTLPSDLTLVAYHILDEEILAFVYREGGLTLRRQVSQAPRVAQHLAALEIEWQRFQADPAFIRRHLPRLTRSVQHILHALYRELIAPLAGLLAGSARLTIIPHGPLHHLPFAALFDGRSYLIDLFEISVAPSATVFNLSREWPEQREGAAHIFGVADPLIPFALQEAIAVSRRLSDPHLHLREAATIATLQRETAGCALLHLACHGLFRRDNPFFSALKLHDGWLTAGEAMQLKLPGAFVTLSACESGRSEVIGGDELLGLVHAFLGAGAAGMLVGLWLVEDETTATLMTEFYSRLAAGDRRPAALRQAQLHLKAGHPHPYYWAPFVLIGS